MYMKVVKMVKMNLNANSWSAKCEKVSWTFKMCQLAVVESLPQHVVRMPLNHARSSFKTLADKAAGDVHIFENATHFLYTLSSLCFRNRLDMIKTSSVKTQQ